MITIREVSGREFSFSAYPYQKTYLRRFVAETSDCSIGPVAIGFQLAADFGLSFWPIASTYQIQSGEYDNTVIIKDVKIVQDHDTDKGRFWSIDVSYGVWNPDTNSVNPLDQPYQINFGYESYEYPCILSRDDNGDFTIPVVNSAGDYFDPPVMMQDSRPTMNVTRNEKTLNIAVLNLYKDAVNSDKFLDCDPGTVRITNITASRQIHPMIGYFFPVSYNFEFKLDNGGQVKRIVDAGYNKLVANGVGGYNKVKIMVNNQEPTTPQLLNGHGVPIPTGNPTFPLGGVDPVWYDFKVYKQLPFADLKLV